MWLIHTLFLMVSDATLVEGLEALHSGTRGVKSLGSKKSTKWKYSLAELLTVPKPSTSELPVICK